MGNCFSDLFTEVKIWYQKTFKFLLGRFLERQSNFQPKYDFFKKIGAINRDMKSKLDFADNHFHSIFRLVDVSPNFAFTTTKKMGDYYL